MSNVVRFRTRRYDAGSQSTRFQNWITSASDADGSLSNPKTIRNRARDLARNNSWAKKGIEVIVSNTVGHGVLAQFKGGKRNAKKIQDEWNAWANSIECDANQINNFYGLQQLAFRSMVESGEVFIKALPGNPLKLQILESDYRVETFDGKLKNGNIVNRGIEYAPDGTRVAYYLYKYHPGATGSTSWGDTGKYFRVPATEIIHLYRQDRPGQETGVSWLAPVVLPLRELSIYEDAYLKRQQIANLHAGFIVTEDDIDEAEEQYTDLSTGLVPGSMSLLRPNRHVEFNSPPAADDYGPFTMDVLRKVSSGLGITFESLTGNLSEVNYSSARMGWQEMARNIETWRWNMFIPRFCNVVGDWFMRLSAAQGVTVEWTPPARQMVDPAKEIPPLVAAIRAGLMTPSEAQRERGYDPRQLMQEWADDAKIMDELGLVFDCDPRQKVNANEANEDTESGTPGETGTSNNKP